MPIKLIIVHKLMLTWKLSLSLFLNEEDKGRDNLG